MEFEITGEQLHSSEKGVFCRPSGRRGAHSTPTSSSSSLFAHISQAQDAAYTPLRQTTTKIHELYKRCNPSFSGSGSRVPARVLTQPSEPLSEAVQYDNKEGNLIARVYDVIEVSGAAYHYTIMDLLGTGTFGQVFRCLKEDNEVVGATGARKPSEVVAVKVVKGKPAYRTQGLLEVKIAKMVNQVGDPQDRHNLVRVYDSFEDRGHVCIVFELLSCSLLDVLTQNQFRGLPLEVVQRFTVQLLSALAVLQDTNIIHCDLKPENILLCPKSVGDTNSGVQKGTVNIKVIDFGSACFEGQTMYSYIQSRFYRSPEVLLGVPYNGAIDMWSLGCVCAEMYLGLPLFPGASQHNQLTRVVDMLGAVPDFLVEHGKNSDKFFVQLSPPVAPGPPHSLLPLPFSLPPSQFAGAPKSSSSLGSILPAALREGGLHVSSFMHTLVSGRTGAAGQGRGACDDGAPSRESALKKHSTNHSHSFRLKNAEEYAAANNQQVPTFRKYLRYDKLDDIVMKCPLPSGSSGHMSSEQKKKEHYRRKCFLDFLKGLLHLNPFDRLTARQAMEHPFVAKYFNKKSKIGTVRVKVPVSPLSSPPRNRASRRSETSGEDNGAAPEYVDKRIFLPPYDDKVQARVCSYQSKMQEVLAYVVPASQLMGRNNVCLGAMKKEQAPGAGVGGQSAAVVSETDTEEGDQDSSGVTTLQDKTSACGAIVESSNGNGLSVNTSISFGNSVHGAVAQLLPLSKPAGPVALDVPSTQQRSDPGVSPAGLISALIQAAPPPRAVQESDTCAVQLADYEPQQYRQQTSMQQSQQPSRLFPPTPPSSLASSYGSPTTGGLQGAGSAQVTSSLPIPIAHPYEQENGKLPGSPYCDSGSRRHHSGSGLSRSSNSVLGSVWQHGGVAGGGVGSASGSGSSSSSSLSESLSSSLFNSGSSFEFGNFLSGVSSSSSLSSNPSFPSTPSQQPLSHFASQPPGSFTPSTPAGSFTGAGGGAFIFGSPLSALSTRDLGQTLQRPELDESRYLQSFGFQQHQHQAQAPYQTQYQYQGQGQSRSERSRSISESSYHFGHSKNNCNSLNMWGLDIGSAHKNVAVAPGSSLGGSCNPWAASSQDLREQAHVPVAAFSSSCPRTPPCLQHHQQCQHQQPPQQLSAVNKPPTASSGALNSLTPNCSSEHGEGPDAGDEEDEAIFECDD